MRKWHFASLDHSPLAYDPASGELSLASRVLVTIHYKLETSTADMALLSDELMDDRTVRSSLAGQAWHWRWIPRTIRHLRHVIITTNAIKPAIN
jgi:hypothetical protein